MKENNEWTKLWSQLYAYVTSGFGLRKCKVLDFYCASDAGSNEANLNQPVKDAEINSDVLM